MIDAALYAFPLAYQWWLHCDRWFSETCAGNLAMEHDVLRAIAKDYKVNRNISTGGEEAFLAVLKASGQGNDMALEERAARLLNAAAQRSFALKHQPLSGWTKVSWFIWPRGWTMYDRLAASAVLGSSSVQSEARFECFYAALAMRGWSDVLRGVRDAVSDHAFSPLLAERAIDKYLYLSGLPDGGRLEAQRIDGFVGALPTELADRVWHAAEAVAEHLVDGRLGHRETGEDSKRLKDRVAKLRTKRKEIA